jgi:hypothetical protein
VRAKLVIGVAFAAGALVLPGGAPAATTQIEVPLTIPERGDITVATAHTKLVRSGGAQLKTTLKKGKRLPRGVSLFARPRQRGRTIAVDLVLTGPPARWRC